MPAADIRNFVLLGHTGSGKTALTEALLVKLGLTEKLGSVSNGISLSDCTEEEIRKKVKVEEE